MFLSSTFSFRFAKHMSPPFSPEMKWRSRVIVTGFVSTAILVGNKHRFGREGGEHLNFLTIDSCLSRHQNEVHGPSPEKAKDRAHRNV